METFKLEGTINLPSVDLNASTGVLQISGRSIPEHPVKFYEPISAWITNYVATAPKEVKVIIHLDYLNTHSTECVLLLLKKLEAYLKSSSATITVLWNFDEDDEDMEALGEDMSSLIQIPFEIKEVF